MCIEYMRNNLRISLDTYMYSEREREFCVESWTCCAVLEVSKVQVNFIQKTNKKKNPYHLVMVNVFHLSRDRENIDFKNWLCRKGFINILLKWSRKQGQKKSDLCCPRCWEEKDITFLLQEQDGICMNFEPGMVFTMNQRVIIQDRKILVFWEQKER